MTGVTTFTLFLRDYSDAKIITLRSENYMPKYFFDLSDGTVDVQARFSIQTKPPSRKRC